MYELIVAMDTDGNIGVTDAMGRQRMPWEREATHKSGEVATHKSKAIKEDMRYFREKTMNNIIIMGRKTFESLPKRPLPGRINIVLTNNPTEYKNSNSVFFTQLEHLDNRIASLLELYPEKRVFVCGGEEIYRILLPKCERLHITCVMDTYSSSLCENETYTKFPTEEDWLLYWEEVDLVAFGPIPERGTSVGIGRFSGETKYEFRSENAFDDDSSLVRRTYVKNNWEERRTRTSK